MSTILLYFFFSLIARIVAANLRQIDALGRYLDNLPVPPNNERYSQSSVSIDHPATRGNDGTLDGDPIHDGGGYIRWRCRTQ